MSCVLWAQQGTCVAAVVVRERCCAHCEALQGIKAGCGSVGLPVGCGVWSGVCRSVWRDAGGQGPDWQVGRGEAGWLVLGRE